MSINTRLFDANGIPYWDYVDIGMGGGSEDFKETRPWGLEEGVVVRVSPVGDRVYVLSLSEGEEEILGSFALDCSKDAATPPTLIIDIHVQDGVITVEGKNVSNGATGRVDVALEDCTVGDGEVVIYNRESVAGARFETQILDVKIEGTPAL